MVDRVMERGQRIGYWVLLTTVAKQKITEIMATMSHMGHQDQDGGKVGQMSLFF